MREREDKTPDYFALKPAQTSKNTKLCFIKKSPPHDFIKRTLREMAREFLTEEEIGDFQDAFSRYTDHDGIINSHELGSVLRQIGLNPTDAELQVRISLIHMGIKRQ